MRFFYYFYAWIPFVALGTIVVLVLPWLAVIALVAVVLGAVAVLGSLAWGVVAALSGLRHPGEHTVPSQKVALESGVGGVSTAFKPIDVYELPDMPGTWNPQRTARRDAGR